MSRRSLISVLVVVLAAAALAIGIAASRAQGSTATLPTIAPAQLMARVAAAQQTTKAVSGSVAWSNGLIPGSDLTSLFGGSGAAPTSLTGLLMGGAGRLWIQQGAGLRLRLRRLALGQDTGGTHCQHAAGLGRSHLARGPMHQPLAEPRLQTLQRLGDRGGREAEIGRGGSKGFSLCNLREDRPGFEIGQRHC